MHSDDDDAGATHSALPSLDPDSEILPSAVFASPASCCRPSEFPQAQDKRTVTSTVNPRIERKHGCIIT
jgi:hypothetical protein